MDLSPTAPVILGILSQGPRSGYEIKTFVDRSTRFFWAASYGQIYPELRKLAKTGLIEGEDASQGGRKRTVYHLTADGERVLRAWLEQPPGVLEMRHEGMLKLFFADALPREERLARLHDMGAQHAAKLAALREIEPAAAEFPESSTYLVLRFGIEFNQWVVDWCERNVRELERELAPEGTR